MRLVHLPLVVLALTACNGGDPTEDTDPVDTGVACDVDVDEDGFCADVDCDDNNPNAYPGANEISDSADNDCDGLVDEGSWAEGDIIITELMINPDSVGDPSGACGGPLRRRGSARPRSRDPR